MELNDLSLGHVYFVVVLSKVYCSVLYMSISSER